MEMDTRKRNNDSQNNNIWDWSVQTSKVGNSKLSVLSQTDFFFIQNGKTIGLNLKSKTFIGLKSIAIDHPGY